MLTNVMYFGLTGVYYLAPVANMTVFKYRTGVFIKISLIIYNTKTILIAYSKDTSGVISSGVMYLIRNTRSDSFSTSLSVFLLHCNYVTQKLMVYDLIQ